MADDTDHNRPAAAPADRFAAMSAEEQRLILEDVMRSASSRYRAESGRNGCLFLVDVAVFTVDWLIAMRPDLTGRLLATLAETHIKNGPDYEAARAGFTAAKAALVAEFPEREPKPPQRPGLSVVR